VAVPTIAAALEMRYLSSRKEERLAASTQLKGPDEIPEVETEQIIEDCRQALYAAKVCSYAQGMCLIKAASDQVLYLSIVTITTTIAVKEKRKQKTRVSLEY
jgi:6-phosphogluconate dehydrogenase